MSDTIVDFHNARKKKGLSLRKLAKLVGVSYEAIRKYEAGVFPPAADVWEKLKDVLDLSGDTLTYWGRSASKGRRKKYTKDDKCKIDGCMKKPVVKGMCIKHYNKKRYAKIKKQVEAAKEEARKRIRG